MHPTANSAALIENLPLITLRAQRVTPGVRRLRLGGWKMGVSAAANLWREAEGKKRSIGVRRGMLETFFL